jgi:signal transduction histidine kinase
MVGFWVFYFITWAAVALRFAISTVPQFGFRTVPAALIGAYLVLSGCLPWLCARGPALAEPLLFLQAAVAAALIILPPLQDFYAIFYLGIALVAGRFLPYGHDIAWFAACCVLPSAALMVGFGVAEGLSYLPTYIMGVLVLGFYGRAARRAEDARAKSEDLLAQLRTAHGELRRYAEQAEEAAAAGERNRLASELHDAATQTVFSITLTAEAARLAQAQDPARLPTLLARIQESSAEALSEMRSLVRELRSPLVAEDGLLATLRQHAAVRERREHLRVIFSVDGEEHGSLDAREALFRTVQEALNNVVKHAGVSEAEVSLAFGERDITAVVHDRGRGFDPASVPSGGFGLAGMRERIESRGGTFTVTSAPGAGTTVSAGLPLAAEE